MKIVLVDSVKTFILLVLPKIKFYRLEEDDMDLFDDVIKPLNWNRDLYSITIRENKKSPKFKVIYRKYADIEKGKCIVFDEEYIKIPFFKGNL